MLNLLQPDASRMTPHEHTPTPDRAPEELAQETPARLRHDLVAMLGEARVHARVIDLIRHLATTVYGGALLAEGTLTAARRE
jgi:D-lactate dehydrogenase